MSYVIIMVLPLTVGIISHNKSVQAIREETRSANISMLKQCMDVLDARLEGIDQIAKQISINPKITQFRYVDKIEEDNTYYQIWETISYLKPYRVIQDFETAFYIYFKKSNTIMDFYTSYQLDNFYGRYFQYKDVAYATWYEEFLNTYHYGSYKPAMDVMVNENKYSVITYLISMPLWTPQFNDGMIMVLINEDKVLQLLNKIDVSRGGIVYIIDENGDIIASLSKDENQEMPVLGKLTGTEGFYEDTSLQTNMYIAYTISSYNGWKYVAAIPSSVVMAKVNFIKTLILTVTIASLVIGSIIAILLAHFNSKPIIDLKQMIKADVVNSDAARGGNEFDFLKNSVSDIISRNKDMQENIKKQAGLLREIFMQQLLQGKFRSLDDIEAKMSHIGVELKGNVFLVVLIHIGGYEDQISKHILTELDAIKAIIKDTVNRYNAEQVQYLSDVDENKIAFLMCFRSNTDPIKKRTEEMIRWIKEQTYTMYHIKLNFSIGGKYSSLTDVSRSFSEAGQAMELNSGEGWGRVIWYDELEKRDRCSFYYPVDIEQRLISLVKFGSSVEVEKLLNMIYDENFKKRKLSARMKQQLRYELYGTAAKVAGERFDNIVEKLDKCASAEAVFEKIQQTFAAICDEINEGKKSHNTRLKNKILEYLDANYMNSDIGLCSVASQFDISEAYLSQFFKEQVGENFSVYLERIRMEHACLLLNEHMPICDLAGRVGYNSDQAFRRAFKRVKGISPTAFKCTHID